MISAPTLVVWGKHDPVIPLKVGRRIAATIPGAELVVIDSGHVPHTTDPQSFAAHLIPFAEAVFAGAGVPPAVAVRHPQ
jgi:pimeloyl-ACP methyl ester carboxylesterase